MQTPRKNRNTSAGLRLIIVSHRNLVALLIINLALFAIAELTYQNAKHPGTVSNIAWYAFLIGAASLVVLVILAIMPRSRRHARGRKPPTSRTSRALLLARSEHPALASSLLTIGWKQKATPSPRGLLRLSSSISDSRSPPPSRFRIAKRKRPYLAAKDSYPRRGPTRGIRDFSDSQLHSPYGLTPPSD